MTERSHDRLDRLYELLPVVYRQRDIAQGRPLRDLLRVIAEQVNAVEDDITQMYDDWFIETCQDWVVPYLGDLVGYHALPLVDDGDDGSGAEARLRTRAAAPRRDVANYLRDLRWRGTLALVEQLASDSAGLPSRAVEFFTLLGRTQLVSRVDGRGRLLDLRDGESLDLIDTPFDRSGHTVDVRNVNARRTPGRHNIPNAGAYVWRLRAYPVTHAPAYFLQRGSGFYFYTFSALGNDAPLFTRAQPEADPTTIAAEINVPAPIRRRALELHRDDYYGLEAGGLPKSFAIWLDGSDTPVNAADIIAADLTGWTYRPPEGKVVVDPQLGRIALSREAKSLAVSYRYGFSGDTGAHESPRTLTQPRSAVLYRVGPNEEFASLQKVLAQWNDDHPAHAVIEIADSGFYTDSGEVDIVLEPGASLQIRAANRCRPVIRVLDYHPSCGESLRVTMSEGSRFTLDGIVLAGRPLRVEGKGDKPVEARVFVRRCTLVPGWGLRSDSSCLAPTEASLEIDNLRGRVTVERSILGTIAVANETAEGEPVAIEVRDSIVDATSNALEAVAGPGAGYAWATVTFVRCTVFGKVLAHAMQLAENTLFGGSLSIVRRQGGCVRFCYVPPDSRTPRRYHCQPDLVEQGVRDRAAPGQNVDGALAVERRRVVPRFRSTRFGDAAYAQLTLCTAPEITGGADDESEMGAFHDLFLPQRVANLRARLDHSTPAGMETGIIYAD
jgi:hypothetical protein